MQQSEPHPAELISSYDYVEQKGTSSECRSNQTFFYIRLINCEAALASSRDRQLWSGANRGDHIA